MPSQPPVSELFVLVAGWPGSGKSTLAAALAAEMRLPLLAKDEIKEALMDGIGWPETVAESQRLGWTAPQMVGSSCARRSATWCSRRSRSSATGPVASRRS